MTVAAQLAADILNRFISLLFMIFKDLQFQWIMERKSTAIIYLWKIFFSWYFQYALIAIYGESNNYMEEFTMNFGCLTYLPTQKTKQKLTYIVKI